jgi:hypothetical protein
METVERTVSIGVTAKAVFDYLDEPAHLTGLIPGAVETEVLEHCPHGVWQFRWTRVLGGVRFEGYGVCAIHSPHRHVRYELSGGLHNEMDWLMQPVPEGTEVTIRCTFGVPEPLKRRHSAETIAQEYSVELDRLVRQLTAAFEKVAP